MYEIPFFPVPRAHARVTDILQDPIFLRVREVGDLPLPILKPWEENPHNSMDFVDALRSNAIAVFTCQHFPERIYISQNWLRIPNEEKVVVLLHELAHADDYFTGAIALRGEYVIQAPAPERIFATTQAGYCKLEEATCALLSTPCEVRAEVRVIQIFPGAGTEYVAGELRRRLKCMRQGLQLHNSGTRGDSQYTLLHTTDSIVFYRAIARAVVGIVPEFANECTFGANEIAQFRKDVCGKLMSPEIVAILSLMEMEDDLARYYHTYSNLLQHLFGSRLVRR
ncbi:MAG: hypothetical protein A3C02_00985 [Candidatus Andersenbacteria bacterium RIFCSPHIGHO2_02_FULL_45_11]|uniref:Uncharacterized protein n=1 Tax=Candidatus Andersenbacteria bacterium RIFCSPHIGHO2_12_FULL_45_11 TaxID=1797281 RepID=A0A1G1WZD6_9BACT|nr:MAG: hypothetical protein A2805_00520 [Candidatus Andersenbacteria bacterium RIFCSPHIGHO2_01_FULL_46_36]OGY33126.1 MAG: hypothetical protein A3D99_01555 [Candidatus Andersenbacteria bacterium RIFCSPHIGHO2_12_FULL_45_11]OGY33150.1 MAG: hypothetical protein A3C02_00985 [Candidatus Andersenbacteria bacterium RIFCSPHIGHO2_02_FULL_45_11]